MKKWFMVALIACVAVGVQAKKEFKAQTKAEYVAERKAKAEKKGQDFDKAKWVKKFDGKDANKDGILTAEENSSKNKNKKNKDK